MKDFVKCGKHRTVSESNIVFSCKDASRWNYCSNRLRVLAEDTFAIQSLYYITSTSRSILCSLIKYVFGLYLVYDFYLILDSPSIKPTVILILDWQIVRMQCLKLRKEQFH